MYKSQVVTLKFGFCIVHMHSVVVQANPNQSYPNITNLTYPNLSCPKLTNLM